jgi:hypothetical protein
MPATLDFFDMSVSVTAPTGHLEPFLVTLGPNWQPGAHRSTAVFHRSLLA